VSSGGTNPSFCGGTYSTLVNDGQVIPSSVCVLHTSQIGLLQREQMFSALTPPWLTQIPLARSLDPTMPMRYLGQRISRRSSHISATDQRSPSRPKPESLTPPYGIMSTRKVG